MTHAKSGRTLDGASYTVDYAGNRTAEGRFLCECDLQLRLRLYLSAYGSDPGGTTTESYSFDAVGNRTASLGVSSYTNNSSNEMTATSAATYTYDYNGNTATKVVGSNTTSYAWGLREPADECDSTGARVELLVSSTTPSGDGFTNPHQAQSVFWLYDGDNLAEETNSSGTAVARYAQGLNIDEPLAMLRSSTTSYYQADGLGSVTSLSNTSGAIATHMYDSFGNLTASTGSLVNPFRYTARESDSETGLYYYRARYYDPSSGRFISEDPIGFSGGNNFYKYVLNDPLNGVDPRGLDTTVIIVYDKGYGGITYGSHAALLIDNGGNPILYDPAGGYSAKNNCGSGQACGGFKAEAKGEGGDLDANLDSFKKFHKGSTFWTLVFKTTPQEEKQIADRIGQIGGAAPGFCATSVSNALTGIGPFKNLKGSMSPGSLANELNNILNPPKPRGGKL